MLLILVDCDICVLLVVSSVCTFLLLEEDNFV